ncbi:MAG: LPXTG cell wall anchor domain-containing protein [Lachnospiraceae bacterium]|nr:LPXTG cell wall anchor domain-containing protein [Lachnospiraceae bacterium]
MKKKLFGIMLTLVFVLSQAVVAYAGPSQNTWYTSASPDVTVRYYSDFTGMVDDLEALSIITLLNDTDATDAEVVNALNKTGDVSIDKANILGIFLNATATKQADGWCHFVVDISNLPANTQPSQLRGLHYSVEREVWEVIEPSSINGRLVEFKMLDCSPLTFYLTSAATSPATGTSANWTLWIGAAVVMFAVAAVACKRSRS